MKHKVITICIAIFLMTIAVSAAVANPDCSGGWMLDQSKSEGLKPGMNQEMTVVQTGDKISIETKLMTEDGEQVIPDSYTLDGKEMEFSPKTQNGSTAKVRRTAKWTSDGIEVNDVATINTPDGETVTVKTTRKWVLAADGKTLQIEIHAEGPNGTQNSKRTFNKK